MTHTIELPPDVEARVDAEAQRRQIPVEEYLRTLVIDALPAPTPDAAFKAQFKTGADVVAYWKREGIIGISLTAATALRLGATLCTFNVKHFAPLPGLVLEQPYAR